MVQLMVIGGFITAMGTAILTVAAVWKLLQGPVISAMQKIESTMQRLEQKVDSMDQRHQNDIKLIWQHLAERKHVE